MLSKILGQTEKIKRGIEKAWAQNQVIANNIANAETPGFKAKEIADNAFESKLGIAEGAGSYSVIEKDDPVDANGNNVNLEQEMSALLKNNIAYEALIRKISMEMQKIEYAINDGKR